MSDKPESLPVPMPPVVPLEQVGMLGVSDMGAREQKLQADWQRTQKRNAMAARQFQAEQEQARMNLLDQVPKLIAAAIAGAVLGYVIPLGESR